MIQWIPNVFLTHCRIQISKSTAQELQVSSQYKCLKMNLLFRWLTIPVLLQKLEDLAEVEG